jgi:hypothetical protein
MAAAILKKVPPRLGKVEEKPQVEEDPKEPKDGSAREPARDKGLPEQAKDLIQEALKMAAGDPVVGKLAGEVRDMAGSKGTYKGPRTAHHRLGKNAKAHFHFVYRANQPAAIAFRASGPVHFSITGNGRVLANQRTSVGAATWLPGQTLNLKVSIHNVSGRPLEYILYVN